MPTMTISIGRRTNEKCNGRCGDLHKLGLAHLLPEVEWGEACNSVVNAVRAAHGTIYFGGEGGGYSEEWGPEPAYTVVCEVPGGHTPTLTEELAVVCQRYRQDAIAVTVGSTHFIAPDRR